MLAAALALLLAAPAFAVVIRAPAAPALPASCVVTPISAAPDASLPSFLSVADPGGRIMLADIIRAAQASPTARRILNQAALTAQIRGRPLAVEIAPLKELGTYSYDTGVLSLSLHDINDNPQANVSTLMHELVHFMQRDLPLPSDLLETELEAYIVDFRVSHELGVKAPSDSFNASAQKELKKGFEPFMELLSAQYGEDALLWKTRSRAYEARLRSVLQRSSSKLKSLQTKRADKNRVLEQMRNMGQSESELDAYRDDALLPLDAAVKNLERALEWARKDLAVLADPETRRQARAYSHSVVRRARAFQKIFARD